MLPDGASATSDAAGAPSSGITGTAGADDEPSAPERLPLPDGPLDAGGEGGEGGEGGLSHAGGARTIERTPRDPAAAASGGEAHSSAGGAGGSEPSAGAAGDTAATIGGAPAVPGVLFFSEYVEGSGSYKALEVYAPSAATLEGCELRTYFNGKLEPARLALHGSLSSGGVQVLCSSTLATDQPNLCDRSTNLTFNGDDALVLACSGVVLDALGQVGVDPGEAWGDGATANHTLRRKCAITSGRTEDTAPFDPELEWSLLNADVFVDLGQHICPPTP